MSLLQSLISPLSRAGASACDTDSAPAATAPTVRPAYDIVESAEAYRVTVQLPGVAKDGLEFTAEAGQLRLTARRAWQAPAGWTPLHRETAGADYALVLTHDHAIAAEQVTAELRDGVLHVTLPKPTAAQPRKIAVN